MKISNINIRNFNQFKDFELDLTYPKGHRKAGLPLDKVCFIGQSGTGKTSLLNLIRAIVSAELIQTNYLNSNMVAIEARTHLGDKITRDIKIDNGKASSEIKQIKNKNKTKVKPEEILEYFKESNILISFPAEINTNFNQILKKNQINLDNPFQISTDKVNNTQDLSVQESLNLRFFDFEISNVKEIWDNILKNINQYKVKQLAFNNEITNKLGNGVIDHNKFLTDFTNWKNANKNPIEDLASKLNTILYKFNLEIRPEFDFKSAEDLQFIKVFQKRRNNNEGIEIPNNFWSTGTKQLVLTATPLFELNTEKSIILIDEPERSFYPDIQKEIINFYTGLAPTSQFFIATHSPIIASQFEPWEIIELKFVEGELQQDKYYEGERAVDNYFIQPQYLRWDSILSKVFDLQEEGNQLRQQKLIEFSELGIKLENLKNEGKSETETAKKLWAEYLKLAKQLDWRD